MVPLLVLKFAVAGGGAYLYLRRYVKNIDYAVLGACLYTFSGFTVYNVFFNHFVDVVALFPYLLWSLDEALLQRPPQLVCVLGGGEPCQQLLLLHRSGGISGHLLHLQAQHTGDFRLTAKKVRAAGL